MKTFGEFFISRFGSPKTPKRFRINCTDYGYGFKTVEVEKLSGDWPLSDVDLITIADGDDPPNARHFGGTILSRYDNFVVVKVYTD